MTEFNIDDEVRIESAFIDTQWTKGRTGTIVRKRKSKNPNVEHVYGVSIHGTAWTLDFYDEELLPLPSDSLAE